MLMKTPCASTQNEIATIWFCVLWPPLFHSPAMLVFLPPSMALFTYLTFGSTI
ncbi:hypothetical protein GLYMA_09G279200v4 [Glycine max]|nr:hypothetical protein GLYMA_09G279200v4 [Glycine max]KAG4389010.1 hypothetical protein GLYMA_09G279200v4 [Glycine max]KAG4389011.1 hypothetical protein GLYMA_09G279200v4 [Glycine max]